MKVWKCKCPGYKEVYSMELPLGSKSSINCGNCGSPSVITELNTQAINPEPEIIVNSKGGKQHKVEGRFDLIPSKPLERVAIVLEQGAEKYGENNWHRIDSVDHINHAIAHLFKYLSGDRSEDHLTNTICRALFASYMVNEVEPTDKIFIKGAKLDESDPGLPASEFKESQGLIQKTSLGNCLCGHHMGFHNRSLSGPSTKHTSCTICGCGEYKDGENITQAGIEKRP